MNPELSASGLQRALACPGSALLPRVSFKDETVDVKKAHWHKGTVKHFFMEGVSRGLSDGKSLVHARGDALAAISEPDIQAECELIRLEGLPLGKPYETEVAFAYDVTTGKARRLKVEGHRGYKDILETEIPGTFDVIGPGEVCDWKFGFGAEGYTAHVKDNAQLKLAALCIRAEQGCKEVRARLIHIKDNGYADIQEATYDDIELDAFAWELRRLYEKLQLLRDDAAYRTPPVTVGPHCRYCSASRNCPSTLQIVAAAAAEPEGLKQIVEKGLTLDNVKAAYERFEKVQAALNEVRQAIIAFANREGAFEIRPGWAYGPHVIETSEVDGAVAFSVLKQCLGEGLAEGAVEMTVTKTAIKDAVREWVKEAKAEGQKVTISGIEEDIYGAIARCDGIVKRSTVRVEKFKTHQIKE